jgi:hypothetical protein
VTARFRKSAFHPYLRPLIRPCVQPRCAAPGCLCLRLAARALLFLAALVAAPAQDAETRDDTDRPKRIFAVLPNYRTTTADGQPSQPMRPKDKLSVTWKDTFDFPVFFIAGAWAGLYQFEDRYPSYGQGMEGYAKRYASALGDQSISNALSEGVFPVLLHQDPRYYRLGPGRGTGWQRTRYALTRIFVTRNDQGKWVFNASEIAGVSSATAISNLYYPDENRTVSSNLEKLGFQLGGDAIYNVLREFWPDWRRKFARQQK